MSKNNDVRLIKTNKVKFTELLKIAIPKNIDVETHTILQRSPRNRTVRVRMTLYIWNDIVIGNHIPELNRGVIYMDVIDTLKRGETYDER